MSNDSSLSLPELNDRIAVIRDNIRQLVEQAAASSGARDEERTSGRIDRLRTEVCEAQPQDFPYLIIGHTGDTEPPSLRERLQPRSNVHAITKQITGADHYVADVHPHAEIDVTVLRKR